MITINHLGATVAQPFFPSVLEFQLMCSSVYCGRGCFSCVSGDKGFLGSSHGNVIMYVYKCVMVLKVSFCADIEEKTTTILSAASSIWMKSFVIQLLFKSLGFKISTGIKNNNTRIRQ